MRRPWLVIPLAIALVVVLWVFARGTDDIATLTSALGLEASRQNPPPVPLPENVRSLRKERNIRLSRGPVQSRALSHSKKKTR